MNLKKKLTESPRRFIGITWGATLLVVFLLLGFTAWRLFPAAAEPAPTTIPTLSATQSVALPDLAAPGYEPGAIVRKVALVTVADKNVRYKVIEYKAKQGDTVSSIRGIIRDQGVFRFMVQFNPDA